MPMMGNRMERDGVFGLTVFLLIGVDGWDGLFLKLTLRTLGFWLVVIF